MIDREGVGYPRDAEAVLARAFLGNGIDVLACVAGLGPESLGHELLDPTQALGPEVIALDDPEREPIQIFLDDLELGDAGNQHGEVLGERDPRDQLATRGGDVVGLAALDPLQEWETAA